jgi:hypothetical protein
MFQVGVAEMPLARSSVWQSGRPGQAAASLRNGRKAGRSIISPRRVGERVASGRNGAAILAALLDRCAPLVQSNTPEAKAELISDKKLPSDSRSLFDTVPFSSPLFVTPLPISSAPRGKKARQRNGEPGQWFRERCPSWRRQTDFLAIHES